ncbi:MAG: HAMP domain-containing histidine kinase [Methylococcales bacterium]|nr:HAMP domain-containing histidine kinase [Methylococcales bacterium]
MQSEIPSDPSDIRPDRRKKRRLHPYYVFRIGSVFQWTLLIFFLVTLPLVITLFYSVYSIQEYTDKSNKTLFQILKISSNNQELLDSLLSMERSIRQYQVLDDQAIFTRYKRHHQSFVMTAELISHYQLPKILQKRVTKLSQDEENLYYKIVLKQQQGLEKLTTDDIQGYVQLRSETRQLVMQSNWQITKEGELLSEFAVLVRERVVKSAIVSVVLTLLLCLLLLYLINKPIKGIGQAIHRLGNAEFNEPIFIEGPKDLREIGTHLEWLRQKLVELENSKQSFIRTISHELKTPLATLTEGADLLKDEVVGKLNTEQFKIIELLQIAGIKLHDLIENLLEYQKVDANQAPMIFSEFNLNKLIKQIFEDYQLSLRSKHVGIEFEADYIDFIADRDKMKIIISNLFSNALKFSPEGGQINIKLKVIDWNLHLLIADQGPGVSEQLRPYIFNEFYKQPTPDGWKISGSGIGLSLVRDYVNAHQGQVRLLSSNEQYCGARFLIILPLSPKALSDNIPQL